ncbi:MAG TPA: hypothetical protein VFD84_01090, partial [Candidatus Binatia bacterium]|nr:hypothetical protein [Candidatus Binatia bacterium]
PFEMPPNHVWTEDDNVAFVEARCVQITSVVFADADTTSLLLRMARGTDFVRETMAVIDARVVALIEADVRAAMQAGALRMSDPRIIAQFIVGGIEKIVVTALDEGRQLDIARLAHEVAVLVSGGVVRRDAVRPPAGPGA